MSKRSKSSRRKIQPYFLDRNLGAEKLAAILRHAGLKISTHHDWYGPQGTLIEDPQIIADCGKRNTVLITADSDLEFDFGAEIYSAKTAVLILGNNNDGPNKWGPRILTALQAIEDQMAMRRRPFVLRLGAEAKLIQVRLYRKPKDRVIRLNIKDAEFVLTSP